MISFSFSLKPTKYFSTQNVYLVFNMPSAKAFRLSFCSRRLIYLINPTNKLNLHFDPFSRESLPTELPPVFLGFPVGSDGKESICNAGDLGLIPGLGRSPGGGYGNPLQYSCLENPHGWRSLVCYSPGGLKKSDMTE